MKLETEELSRSNGSTNHRRRDMTLGLARRSVSRSRQYLSGLNKRERVPSVRTRRIMNYEFLLTKYINRSKDQHITSPIKTSEPLKNRDTGPV